MEPQVMAEHYLITLTDDNGSIPYYKDRLEVGDFINNINWGEHGTRVFTVAPVEPLADWELELLNAVNSETTVRSLQDILSDPETPSPWSKRNKISENGTVTYKKQRVDDDRQALEEPIRQTRADFDEWRTIESLPVRSFEIDRSGNIRHRASKRIMEAHFDMDHQTYRTPLKINGQDLSVSGQLLAKAMWRDDANAS